MCERVRDLLPLSSHTPPEWKPLFHALFNDPVSELAVPLQPWLETPLTGSERWVG